MENKTMNLKKEIPKITLKVAGVLILGMFLGLRPANPTDALIENRVILLGLLALLVTGLIKISYKNPTGWSLLATFMYLFSFAHFGITAWAFVLSSVWLYWVALAWRYNLRLLGKTQDPWGKPPE
jgi:hypothetical protein